MRNYLITSVVDSISANTNLSFHSILPSLATVAFIKLSLGKFADSLRSLSETTPASHAIALKDKYIYH